MDGRGIILVSETKSLKNIAAMAIFPKGTQNGRFWPKCKGGTLCKILEIGRFLGQTSEGSKTRKYLSDFSLIGLDGRGI